MQSIVVHVECFKKQGFDNHLGVFLWNCPLRRNSTVGNNLARNLSGWQNWTEFSVLFSNFAFDEVLRQSKLDDKTRSLAVLATLLGCQGLDAFRAMMPVYCCDANNDRINSIF